VGVGDLNGHLVKCRGICDARCFNMLKTSASLRTVGNNLSSPIPSAAAATMQTTT